MLNELLTIVIPCKNEKEIISKSLDLLNHQNNIEGVKVVVCDSSDDGITRQLLLGRLDEDNNDKFNLIVIDGGLPAKARNEGFKLVSTPYVLFMDSDIFLLDSNLLIKTISKIYEEDLDLVTVKFRTDNGNYNYVYKVFDVLQSL